jgi:hypothetical protein
MFWNILGDVFGGGYFLGRGCSGNICKMLFEVYGRI